MRTCKVNRRSEGGMETRLASCSIVVVSAILLLTTPPAASAEPTLNFVIEDKHVLPDDTLVTINAWMNSREHPVASFETILYMSDHNVLRFHETNPITNETAVTHDWGWFAWYDFGNPDGFIVKIVAIYNGPGRGLDEPEPIPAGDEPQLIFTINTTIVPDDPDTLCSYTGTVVIDDKNTKFAVPYYTPNDPYDDLIGYVLTTEYDTTFENCVEWIGDSCISWADTIVEETTVYGPDWELLNYVDGQYEFIPYIGGDADGSGSTDIDDVVYLISFIFSGGPPPDPYESGDADCSGGVDIDDVVRLIGYIFSGGPEPCYECP